jgi:hypothetical protein
MVRLRLDDGAARIVARDLATGAVQVTDETGNDITPQYRDPGETDQLGRRLFELDRHQFEEISTVSLDGLRRTVGNGTLIHLLHRGRIPGPPSEEETPDPAPPSRGPSLSTPEEEAGPEPESDSEEPLHIFRSPSEEMEYVHAGFLATRSPSPTDPASLPVSSPAHLPAEVAPHLGSDVALSDTSLTIDEVDDFRLDDTTRLRRLKAALDTLDVRLEQKAKALQAHSERLGAFRSEGDRLAMLTGAEPKDVENLEMLLDVMSTAQERRDRVRVREQHFRRELSERQRNPERVLRLCSRFERLSEEDLRFLNSYRREETVRRGNQALVRSESRLDESRIEAILQTRTRESRPAVVPLGVAIFGLLTSTVLHLFPGLQLVAIGSLVVGFAGAVIGAAILWRAKRTGENDRNVLFTSLRKKSEQLEEIEQESRVARQRMAEVAGKLGIEDPEQLPDLYEEWEAAREDGRELERFARQGREIDAEIVKVREKLGSFIVENGRGQDPTTMTAEELEAMRRDYVRFFEIQRELKAAEEEASGLESDLAQVEVERAGFRDRIGDLLGIAGLEPGEDLDEAIERHAMRRPAGIPNGETAPDGAGEAPERETLTADAGMASLRPEPEGDASWVPAVSARAEAILRRFLPEARELEIDLDLSPSVRLDARGPRLSFPELAVSLSEGTLDQVCLALRLAIVETLSASGERVPVLLDDPLVRCDDQGCVQAMEFLVTDLSTRGQAVLLTCHELRARWFLHQFPQHQARLIEIADPARRDPSSDSSVDCRSS